jgi:uncharacterized membrane protein YeaQ/YmgE (transglycosylase-associated protein family)
MVIAATQLLAQAGDKGGDDIDVASILGYIVVGIIVGVVARFLVPGRDPMGVIGTILLGIVGAVVGGWAAGELLPETTGVDWIASIVVAVLLVLLWRAVSGNRTTINS